MALGYVFRFTDLCYIHINLAGISLFIALLAINVYGIIVIINSKKKSILIPQIIFTVLLLIALVALKGFGIGCDSPYVP